MFHHGRMKTVGVRDLRQRWPAVEKALAREGELIVTKDGKPVAKLTRVEIEEKPRRRFDPEENRRWMKKFWGDRVFDVVGDIARDREDD